MNKKILSTLILIIVLVGLCGAIYVKGRKDIPKLTVTYNGKNVEVGQGPYKWKSRGKLKEHTLDSYTTVLVKLSPGMKVPPNGQLKLSFDYQPETITLRGGNKSDGKIIKDNVINISDYGTGGYILDCRWKEGKVIYMIYVDIHH
ncbi:hypothetical protein RBU49_08365 [Clostridium sp. MB40-C1]|uniref:hypothetical protein n=1 Tax=Clostridium sp. MB40-C1 TaxID=3070996 RepID=UPI0027E043FA|nr:hypothetical protein [Clostridium sp. MB40-C1]WMJ82247.1 hypothetical protein RBU49_08365 [Clostridium sp. MB40-C1]